MTRRPRDPGGLADPLRSDGNIAPPALFLPMRLEYRYFHKGQTYRRAIPGYDVRRLAEIRYEYSKALASSKDDAALEFAEKLAEFRENANGARPKLEEFEPEQDELWLRWFPDSNFAETGPGPMDENEIRLIHQIKAFPHFRDWPDLGDAQSEAVWLELLNHSGPARAVHLMRYAVDGKEVPDLSERLGRIAALPFQVMLFTLTGDRIQRLAAGTPIPPNTKDGPGAVSYSPEALGDMAWAASFPQAVAEGMGLRLADSDQISQAREADWIMAVGLDPETDGLNEIDRLFQSHLAAGQIGFIPAESATNNAEGAATDLLPNRSEAAQYVLDATRHEAQVFQKDKERAAQRLARALGLDSGEMEKHVHSDESSAVDAAAMIRVIGPALIDGALQTIPLFDALDENQLIDAIAASVQAGGPLAAMRFGDGAYGIAPVMDFKAARIKNNLTDAQGIVGSYAAGWANLLGAAVARSSADLTLRLLPGDPDSAEKLDLILNIQPGAVRLDVGDDSQADVKPVGCPYVRGPLDHQAPAQYLRNLVEDVPRELPDPDHTVRNWPLLYRLARLSLMRNRLFPYLQRRGYLTRASTLEDIQGDIEVRVSPGMQAAVGKLRGVSVEAMRKHPADVTAFLPRGTRLAARRLNNAFDDALERLRGVAGRDDGDARLTRLMMDVVDLFQYRIDAWMTGFAHLRIEADREGAARKGLTAGHYGILGKLRTGKEDGSVEPGNGGYVQAPSPPQASAAAVLYSAHVRNQGGDGAFSVNLRSGRVSRALKLMDFLRKGHGLPQALGLCGERWLRDNGHSNQTAALREDFPIANANDTANQRAAISRVMDGLAFVQAARPSSAPRNELHDALTVELDTLADLVMAEAVYQRMQGEPSVANAWLQVLSGGAVPDRPEFIRSERLGHASDYRVSVVLPLADQIDMDVSPLRQADPGASAFLADLAPAFNDLNAAPSLRLSGDDDPFWHEPLSLAKQMNLTPAELAMDGIEGLGRWLKQHALLHAMRQKDFADRAAKLAAYAPEGFPNWRLALIEDDGIESAGTKLSAALNALVEGGKLLRSATPMTPGDMNAAAAPDKVLDDAARREALKVSLSDSWQRLKSLHQRLKGDILDFETRRVDVMNRVAKAMARRDAQPSPKLWALLADLGELLLRLRRWGERGADVRLLLDTPYNPAVVEEALVTVEKRLRERWKTLDRHINAGQPATASAEIPDLRAQLAADQQAIRDLLDRPRLPLFAQFARVPATSPLIERDEPVAQALGEWLNYRARLGRLSDLLGPISNYRSNVVARAATADDAGDPDADLRPETTAPRSYHYGHFLGPPARLAQAKFAGLVVDEWVEKRPSDRQNGAIALNYDAPQAEAANLMILAPAGDTIKNWDEDQAVAVVAEAIKLLQIRSLTTQNTPITDGALPNSNRVAYTRNDTGQQVPRIPETEKPPGRIPWNILGAQLSVAETDLDIGPFGSGWNQILRRPIRGGDE